MLTLYFFRSGYNSASKSFSKGDLDKDVSGNVYMVTGANSGIGKAAALSLAKKGGEVHIVCRNPERGNQAKDDIIKESSNEVNICNIVCLFVKLLCWYKLSFDNRKIC